MELVSKSINEKVKYFFNKIAEDNLFLLSSSISYYSALALAPFMLILLGVASLIGQDIQEQIIQRANITFSSEVGAMIQLIFNNVNEGLSFGSISGIVGIVVLLWTASLVFLQLRYSFDVIYGHYDPEYKRSFLEIIFERIFAMMVVLMAGIFFIFSISLGKIIQIILGPDILGEGLRFFILLMNFLIYFFMFLGIHYFVPTRRPDIKNCAKISLLSSVFFIIGNFVLTSYLKRVAADSIYGAAGSLFVFLIWSYYSSFTVFLSVEVFLYFKKLRKGHWPIESD